MRKRQLDGSRETQPKMIKNDWTSQEQRKFYFKKTDIL